MVWWIRSLEIEDEQGQATGKYRLTATSNEHGGPYGLCDHEHLTVEEAQNCGQVSRHSPSLMVRGATGVGWLSLVWTFSPLIFPELPLRRRGNWLHRMA